MNEAPLRQRLDTAQRTLLTTIYEPFAETSRWPIWQYVELVLDGLGEDAAEVLQSLPTVRNPSQWGTSYALVWYMNPGTTPNADQEIALTVAGLNYLSQADDLLGALIKTVRYLVAEQTKVIPSPTTVVEATVSSRSIEEHLLTASIEGRSAAPVEMTMNKLYSLTTHEPILFVGAGRPSQDRPEWFVRVPWALRELRGVTTVDEYIDRIINWVAPAIVEALEAPTREAHLPTAVGYLDAVWKSRTGAALFAGFDPTSISRLTEACASETDFNALLSALADVLGQVVAPGTAKAPQRAALETCRDALVPLFEAESAVRVRDAIDQLILIRQLRVSTQHADARHRAVVAFEQLGLAFPPPSWSVAWTQVASLAEASLGAIRQEALANLQPPG